MTTPAVTAVYTPARRRGAWSYEHRTVERADADTELRVLGCFHASRGIPTLLNLVEASRDTRRSKLTLYLMHLVELSERSSAISMVQRAPQRAAHLPRARELRGRRRVRGVPAP
jgi:hypothetical protein